MNELYLETLVDQQQCKLLKVGHYSKSMEVSGQPWSAIFVLISVIKNDPQTQKCIYNPRP